MRLRDEPVVLEWEKSAAITARSGTRKSSLSVLSFERANVQFNEGPISSVGSRSGMPDLAWLSSLLTGIDPFRLTSISTGSVLKNRPRSRCSSTLKKSPRYTRYGTGRTSVRRSLEPR